MDPQTLPERELALYTSIKEKYKIAFEPLKIREHQLHLLKIADLEQILDGKDPLKNVSEFPVWVKLWEAAIVLAEFIAAQKVSKGTTLLELGAGLGASGLTAAAAGFDVTLTDYEELILNFERISAAASNLQGVNFTLLDWLNPPALEQYDVIIAAEILYREEFFQPLLNIFTKALKPGGVIYLAHDMKRKNVKPFLHMAEEIFKISASTRTLKSLEGDTHILLTRLTL